MASFTVNEVLTYAAILYGYGESEVKNETSKVIQSMGLIGTENTKCSGLSGGQQRRLSLAISLVKKPDILFLDEITSGLDSVSSLKVCELLRQIADERNVAALCTIHQPSHKVFENFDQLMVLSMGRLAYAGGREEAEKYFASNGYPMPSLTSEAEHYLDTVDADFGSQEKVEKFLNSWTGKSTFALSEEIITQANNVMTRNNKSHFSFVSLLSRQFLLIRRDVSSYCFLLSLLPFIFSSFYLFCSFCLAYIIRW